MLKNRKAMAAVAAVVAVLAIYQDPQTSADAVRGVLDIANDAVSGVLTFAGAVTQ